MPPKEQTPGTPVPMNAPATATTPVPMTITSSTTISAGTPVQTYPSPAHATAHAQWAAAGQIDPSLQQQTPMTAQATPAQAVATTTAPRAQHAPAQATTTQAAAPNLTAQNLQAYYQNYAQHYPYYAQYISQALSQAQQQQSGHTAQTHTPTPVATPQAHRPTIVATPAATATSTPVAPTYTPAAIATGQTAAPATTTMPAASNSLDTNDISTLNDALGSAGVDLRAEEESLTRHDAHQTQIQHHSSIYLQNRPYEDRSKKQPYKPAFDTRALGITMRAVGSQHKVTRIPDESINYMALALRARLQDLITDMIKAARYRKEAQFERPASFYETLQQNGGSNSMDVDGVKQESQTPMWSIIIRSDVAKQLAVLERVEREEEMRIRRERKERQELAAAHSAAMAAQTAGGGNGVDAAFAGASGGALDEGDGQPKKKKKKEGPGVTARNMSEDVRKKMSNAVATQAAGLGKYAWMTAAASSSPAPKPKPVAEKAPAAGAAGTWARPYKKPTLPTPTTTATPDQQQKTEGEDPNKVVLTMRDAMFVVEKERGHGGGKGAARGWT